jgi:predicted pyridoxine 5'-phosphate oxidase superfamily flavin-nucleotide-binding protein
MIGYHEGEIAVQERAGVRDAAARLEGMIAETIPERALPFLANQRAVAACAAAPDGHLWASLWLGAQGFLTGTPTCDQIVLRRDAMSISPDDPVFAQVAPRAPLGLLAIDFDTRRRLRLNGVIAEGAQHDSVVMDVHEAFVNCPKYIQRRVVREPSISAVELPTQRGDMLDATRKAFIARADTAFIATTHPTRGLDVSHRGGSPGFIAATGDRTFSFPDYSGNNIFATLGNLAVASSAGFAIVDFAARRILSMTGRAILVDNYDRAYGIERGCEFHLDAWVEFTMHGASSWELLERSPFNPPCFACVPEPSTR